MPFWGFLGSVPGGVALLVVVLAALALGYAGASLRWWVVFTALVLYGIGAAWYVWLLVALALFPFLLAPVRLRLSGRILRQLRASSFLPRISSTEQAALDAGTVWIEREFFSGRPDFSRISQELFPALTADEQAFLDGPVEEVCELVNDWDVQQNGDLPPEVWDYLKRYGFFGMIIPKTYGGLEFSPLANSAVVQKLTSRSLALGVTVMVPNSLGPAELLIHYGTDAQRDHYLPRLARGEEIPCFALTEPGAGSDAAALTSRGDLFRGPDGTLRIRLNWNKRYITLAAVSTLIGLAFRLYDPEHLLGGEEDLGITCALIPSDADGVILGRRHDPLGIPFINSPTDGHDVEVPADAIIGGLQGAGRGWRMLMESLAAGRGISLPAQACAGAKVVTRVASGHALVRRQFGLPLGRFEGIEAPLAKIAGMTYLLDAARVLTCGALSAGAKPAVTTAMLKYHATELQRELINHGMDILGGNGISRGPRNLLAGAYSGAPIGITVEGANILTRTLIIFGQGAIRCHPYAYSEIRAVLDDDIAAFDGALWSHVGHLIRNGCRAFVLSVTRGYAAVVPGQDRLARYYRRLAWASASFAFWADLAMIGLGGELKRKELISGRFADILSWLYLGTAALRRFEEEDEREQLEPLMRYAVESSLAHIQEAFTGLFMNLRIPGLTLLLRGPINAWSRVNPLGRPPDDELSATVAQAIQVPGSLRDRLVTGTFVSHDEGDPTKELETAVRLAYEAEFVSRKIKNAIRRGDLEGDPTGDGRAAARSKGVISDEEDALIDRAEQARARYIQVDDFDATVRV